MRLLKKANNFLFIVNSNKFNDVFNSLPYYLGWPSPQFQVFNSIVMSYSIPVMNCFEAFQFSSKMLFHYVSMFGNNFTFYANSPVSHLISKAICPIWISFLRIPRPSTQLRAKGTLKFVKRTWVTPYNFITHTTWNFLATYIFPRNTFQATNKSISAFTPKNTAAYIAKSTIDYSISGKFVAEVQSLI